MIRVKGHAEGTQYRLFEVIIRIVPAHDSALRQVLNEPLLVSVDMLAEAWVPRKYNGYFSHREYIRNRAGPTMSDYHIGTFDHGAHFTFPEERLCLEFSDFDIRVT